jgi:DNA-binding response OmpR family regulator
VAINILFVDDEAPIRELLSLFFRKKGIEVGTATTGQEALSVLEDRKFDAAIVDLNLAGENGLELLRHFKREYPKMPVIIFTGMTGDPTLVDQAKAAGADGFMRKAESLGNLYDEVKKHLPQQPAA